MTQPRRAVPLGRDDLPPLRGRGLPAVEPLQAVRLLALVAGAAAIVLGASAWVVVAALAVSGGAVPGATAALATAATQLRWGTADLDAVLGNQSVLGASVVVGPAAGWSSAVLGAGALVVAGAGAERRSAPSLLAPGLAGVFAGALFGWSHPRPAALASSAALAGLAVAVGALAADRRWRHPVGAAALAGGCASAGLAALV